MKKIALSLVCVASLSAAYATTPTFAKPFITSQLCATDSVDLNQYVGKYKFTGLPFDYITISMKDGKLTVDTGTEQGELTPIKDTPDKFDAAGRATLLFTRDENKKVTGTTLEAQGMSFDGKKE